MLDAAAKALGPGLTILTVVGLIYFGLVQANNRNVPLLEFAPGVTVNRPIGEVLDDTVGGYVVDVFKNPSQTHSSPPSEPVTPTPDIPDKDKEVEVGWAFKVLRDGR